MPAFESLAVWQKAHELALEIYGLTEHLPQEERYGLVSQLRRAAVSVAANIVEGHARGTPAAFGHFLSIGLGSLAEVQCLLLLCRDIGYLSGEQVQRGEVLAAGLVRMMHKLKDTIADKER